MEGTAVSATPAGLREDEEPSDRSFDEEVESEVAELLGEGDAPADREGDEQKH